MPEIKDFREVFEKVPNDYRLNWFSLNHDQNIEEILQYGIGGLTICVPYKDYLKSPEGWANYRRNVLACREADISLWIMDEWGYPSGMAGGLVVEEDSALESMGLLMQKETAPGGTKIDITLPEGALSYVYAAYYPVTEKGIRPEDATEILPGGDSIGVTLPVGKSFAVYAFARTYLFDGIHSEVMNKNWKYSGHYPNLLLKESTRRFISLTHEQYKENTPDFASTLRIFYGDEPSLTTVYVRDGNRPGEYGIIAWSDLIAGEFEKRYGYTIFPRLPALFEGMDEWCKGIRIHFYRLIGDLLRENWTEQIAHWCRENGTHMSYHYFAEESLTLQVAHYGDMMHMMEPMQIPSVDVRLCLPGMSRHKEITAVRMVASVARHSGDKQTRAELDPILGGFTDARATIVAIRDNANYCFAMGLNNMTTYGNWKDHPEGSKAIEEAGKYIGRIELLLRDAVYLNNIGIFYPIETYQSEYTPTPEYIWTLFNRTLGKQQALFDLDEQLMNHQISASYLTPQILCRSCPAECPSDGVIHVGKHDYDTLFLIDVRVLSLEVARRLITFEKNGGKLVWYGSIPSLATEENDHETLRTLLSHSILCSEPEEVLQIASERQKTPLHVTTGQAEDDKKLTAQVFYNQNNQISYVASLSVKSLQVTVDIDGQSDGVICDPMTGKISNCVLPVKIMLGPSESILIINKM